MAVQARLLSHGAHDHSRPRRQRKSRSPTRASEHEKVGPMGFLTRTEVSVLTAAQIRAGPPQPPARRHPPDGPPASFTGFVHSLCTPNPSALLRKAVSCAYP